LKGVKELQQQVLDGELTGWKREQQLAGNGLQMTQSLETIQVGFRIRIRINLQLTSQNVRNLSTF
jgi:hypothetical protein